MPPTAIRATRLAASLVLLAVTRPLAAQQGVSPSPPRHVSTGTASPDPRLYADLKWRNVRPFRAGRVSAVSGAIGQPGVFYAGFPGGGLWKTTSVVHLWFPVFDAIREVSSIGAVAVAPSDARVAYVGTGDTISGGTLDRGNGACKTTDAGATFGTAERPRPDTGRSGTSVYKSADNGVTWTELRGTGLPRLLGVRRSQSPSGRGRSACT